MVWSRHSSFPQSKKCCRLISATSRINFFRKNLSEKFLGMPRIKPGAAGWEARTLPLSYAAPQRSKKLIVLSWYKVRLLKEEAWTNHFLDAGLQKALVLLVRLEVSPLAVKEVDDLADDDRNPVLQGRVGEGLLVLARKVMRLRHLGDRPVARSYIEGQPEF